MKIQQLLAKQTELTSWKAFSPKRCRVILADKLATHVVGVERQKPNQPPYVVFPGGGVEDTDKDPLATIEREIYEELNLDTSLYALSDVGISINDEFGHQFYFLAEMQNETTPLKMHGPESNRNTTTNGTYSPQWYSLDTIDQVNLVPKDIKNLLHGGVKNAQNPDTKHCQKRLF